MKKLTNLIKSKSPETKKMIGLGVATAIGAAKGVKTVAEKRKADLANSEATKKVTEAILTTVAAGSKVVSGVREDLSIVVGSAKSQSCAARCAHCAVKDTYKPCCTDGKSCKVAEVTADEDEETPAAPVKAEEVVTSQSEADAIAETLKNDMLKAEERVAAAEAKKATRKPRTPRVAKANAKPVSVKETEVTVTPKDVAEETENADKED